MKKLKFIYLVLLSFGLILLSYSAEVKALEGWEFHEESPFETPSLDDAWADTWVRGSSHGVEGEWLFNISFELEYPVSLQELYIYNVSSFMIELYLQTYEEGGYDDWLQVDAYDYFDEMNVQIQMILYDEVDFTMINISDKAYELLEGYPVVFENMHIMYPAEKVIYRIDFHFSIEFDIDLTDLEFDEITNEYWQYEIELYYNSSVYNDVYEKGFDDGYDEGYDDGYYDGLVESDVYEVYQQGFKDGEKSKIAENNAAFYSGIEKWLVPAVIAVIVLGGILSIAAIKRREQ